MTYDLVPEGAPGRPGHETSDEYRRTHYRVFDENGFASAFDVLPPECATLESVAAHLRERWAGRGGTGFDSKDLVVLLGPRIVAVVRRGKRGEFELTTFAE